jgi:hypothetical protein
MAEELPLETRKRYRSLERVILNAHANLNGNNVIIAEWGINDHDPVSNAVIEAHTNLPIFRLEEQFQDVKSLALDATNPHLTEQEAAFVAQFNGNMTIQKVMVLIKAGIYTIRAWRAANPRLVVGPGGPLNTP